MVVGDRIRFLHSKGEGIIRKIIDDRSIEVEIEDGFRIPVFKNEIVVVSKDETNRFSKNSAASAETAVEIVRNKDYGIFFAFVPFNDKVYSLYLVNNTSNTILFTLAEKSTVDFQGISSGILGKKNFEKIKEFKIADFDFWPEFFVQTLLYAQGKATYSPPVEKSFKLKAANFFKSKRYHPVIDKEAFLYQLLENTKPLVQEDVKDLFTKTSTPGTINMEKPLSEVDLHIEKINPNYKSLSNSEILNYQVTYFEKQLENAIASGMKEIIFIHGAGSGALKNSLHKKLSQNLFIEYFEDARKEKFGYGATLVKIK